MWPRRSGTACSAHCVWRGWLWLVQLQCLRDVSLSRQLSTIAPLLPGRQWLVQRQLLHDVSLRGQLSTMAAPPQRNSVFCELSIARPTMACPATSVALHNVSLNGHLSTIAAPPQRNSVFCRSMERSLPWYRFCVRFSVDTTSAMLLGRAIRRSRARSWHDKRTTTQQLSWYACTTRKCACTVHVHACINLGLCITGPTDPGVESVDVGLLRLHSLHMCIQGMHQSDAKGCSPCPARPQPTHLYTEGSLNIASRRHTTDMAPAPQPVPARLERPIGTTEDVSQRLYTEGSLST